MAITEYIATDRGRELLQILQDNPGTLRRLRRPGNVETLTAVANEGPISEDELVDTIPGASRAVNSLRQTKAIEAI